MTVKYWAQPARGEFTLVIEGKRMDELAVWTEDQLRAAIEQELKTERSAKEISTHLAETSGWSKREIYSFINKM